MKSNNVRLIQKAKRASAVNFYYSLFRLIIAMAVIAYGCSVLFN